jgi:hypothetical protein
MTHEETKLVKRVYASNDPKVTHAVYAYWRFWHANGGTIDFAASPSVNTFAQACKLVKKYYPNAEVIQATKAPEFQANVKPWEVM